MFVLIGLAVVFGSVILGYLMHHGNMAVLIQVSEFIIIGGAAIGSMMVGNPPSVLGGVFKESIALVKGNPYQKGTFADLLLMLFELFQIGKQEGMLALEPHVERPEDSDIFNKYPFFAANPQALSFLTDTMKVLLTGTVEKHALAEVLELDLERHHEEALTVSKVLARTGDAMPGFGIVAAVLGVVITMGSIGGPAADIGRKVAAALVGTFLGILMAYGVFQPMAQACENIVRCKGTYLGCIKTALLAFSSGDPPITAIEFARRNIEPSLRPSFGEMEERIRTWKTA